MLTSLVAVAVGLIAPRAPPSQAEFLEWFERQPGGHLSPSFVLMESPMPGVGLVRSRDEHATPALATTQVS